MYQCIEVALRGVPMGSGVQLGLGEGPIKVGPISQPRGIIDTRHSRWTVLAHLCAFSDPTLLKSAKGVLFPHVGGTVTHRTLEGHAFIPIHRNK